MIFQAMDTVGDLHTHTRTHALTHSTLDTHGNMDFMTPKARPPGNLHLTHSLPLQYSLSQCGLCGGRYLDGVITIFYISVASPLESNSFQYSQRHSACTQHFCYSSDFSFPPFPLARVVSVLVAPHSCEFQHSNTGMN